MRLLTLALLLIFPPLTLLAGSEFSAPDISDFHQLSPTERLEYESQITGLESFYKTQKGHDELVSVVQKMWGFVFDFSQIVFLGRSPTFLKGYLEGVLAKKKIQDPSLKDLPLSFGAINEPLALEYRKALRDYLTAKGFSPQQIAQFKKPVLFVDFSFSGRTSRLFFSELIAWASKLGLRNEVIARIGYLELYPALMIAHHHLMQLYHAMVHELPGIKLPTDEEVLEKAKETTPPGEYFLKDLLGYFHKISISTEMYSYSGTHGPNAQKSFTPDQWLEVQQHPKRHTRTLSFKNQSTNPAFQDLFYAMSLGLEEAAKYPDCAQLLF